MSSLVEEIFYEKDEEVYGSRGIYGNFPAFSPKFHAGNFTDTFRTQARLYVPFPSAAAFDAFQGALSERVREYARALSIVDGPEDKRLGYFDFFLQRANESYQEKRQVSEVLSDGYVAYYFGQRAPVWSYSGVVLNTRQDQWYDAFHILYEDVIRGTRLADLGLSVRLSYDTRTVVGSLDAMSTSLSADNETFAPFQFQVLVHRVIYGPTNVSPTIVREFDSPGLLGAVSDIAEFRVSTAMTDSLKKAREDLTAEKSVLDSIRPGANSSELTERFPELDIEAASSRIDEWAPGFESIDAFDGGVAALDDETGDPGDSLTMQKIAKENGGGGFDGFLKEGL